MVKTTNDYVAAYKTQLAKGDIQVAYKWLLQYMLALKAHFSKAFLGRYQCGQMSPGYMDYTYFPFFNASLRAQKLRFGIVLNHRALRFELWLMGQNAAVQNAYWQRLKTTEWNRARRTMPQYAILKAVLIESPCFNDTDALTAEMEKTAMAQVEKILPYLFIEGPAGL